jgi:predicted molibdopterin-dependent oxidoreductase YjgC
VKQQFRRLAETTRARITVFVDGIPADALVGDTLLTVLLTHGRRVRTSEFGDGPRAGFCLIGACQDCWVSLTDGRRLRGCTTIAQDGMSIVTGITAP